MISAWMLLAFGAMFGWGFGQGFTKKFINDVSGTKFCLYFVFAVSTVNIGLWLYWGAPDPFHYFLPLFDSAGNVVMIESLDAAGNVIMENGIPVMIEKLSTETAFAGEFVFWGTFSYVLDGIAWAAYFVCIRYAPIAIVGTVAAAYPAIVMAVSYFWYTDPINAPTPIMWVGGIAVVAGCVLLGYTPKSAVDPNEDNSHVVAKYWIPLSIIAALGWGLAFSCLGYSTSEYASLPGADGTAQLVLSVIGDGIILIPLALIEGKKDTHSMEGMKLAVTPMILFAVGNVCNMLAYSAEGGADNSGLIAAIGAAYPMITLGFAYIFLKERIIAFHWMAIAIIMSGIMLCTGMVGLMMG